MASVASRPATAGTIVGCNNDCIAQIFVGNDPLPAAEGSFVVDPVTGDISLPAQIGVYGPDFSAWITTISGNQDPLIIFGLGATNNTVNPLTFSFAFSLPVSIAQPISANSEVGYTLTDGLNDGVTLFPTSGTGFVVDSQDIRISPFLSDDKRVDVGPACSLPGSGLCGASPGLPYTAGPINWGSVGGPTYNLMTVNVAFGLTPRDAAGLSGKVEQTAIPEPGSLGLLGAGLAALALARRMKRS